MIEIIDITEEYNNNRLPQKGRVIFEDGFQREIHLDEIETAEWLWNTFGGEIKLLCESKRQGEEMPDYLWQGKYWERKGISSSKINTIYLRIKKAYSQIDGKRGGIILDFSTGKMSMENIEKSIKYGILRCAKGTVEMIVKRKSEYKVFRIVKNERCRPPFKMGTRMQRSFEYLITYFSMDFKKNN